MVKIMVTGANGQLGRELQSLAAEYPSFRFSFFTRVELNIADKEAVEKAFAFVQPNFCINCAAYTAVDKAETESEVAFNINSNAVRILAAACRKQSTRFIHISTDYVFDGEKREPYEEEDFTAPLNIYGKSKLEGELACREELPESLILRTSWVYSAYGANFVKTMLRLYKTKEEVKVVDDQWGTPTYAADLAADILQILSGNKWVPGIYHYSNEGAISWYQLAVAIKEYTNTTCRVLPIPAVEYPTPSRRPYYSVMSKEKIKQTYGLSLKPWKESLERCIARLQESF